VIDTESLSILDLLLWLGKGTEVGKRLNISQSTVSRKAAAASTAFDLELSRSNEGWGVVGDPQLLRLERVVHQTRRFLRQKDLRLDADPWLGGALLSTVPARKWTLGRFHHLSHHQPLRLLRERILDFWLTILTDEVKHSDCSDLVCFELGSVPLTFIVAADHPLADQANLALNDLLRYPRLNLASGMLPAFENEVRHRGLWDTPQSTQYYNEADWEGRTSEEAALLYGHTFTLELNPSFKPLDYNLDLIMPIALVVHRDMSEHPATEALLKWLRDRLQEKACDHANLQLAA
jgi:DNA-binding transcriptional LysR family regulator